MTNREREIFNLIQKNPMLSQNEIAKMLSIKRSSVAVHITNLMKKGYIIGKGYIMNESPYMCVVGATNLDITATAKPLKKGDSANGQISYHSGGVARNIAEVVAKYGIDVKFVSAVGADSDGDYLVDQLIKLGVDITYLLRTTSYPTSRYLALLNSENDLLYGVNDMAAIQAITSQYIKDNIHLINYAELVVIDTNLKVESISEVMATNHKRIVADAVSSVKAIKLKPYLSQLFAIKVNQYEIEALTGVKVTDQASAITAIDVLQQFGVTHILLTLGSDGAMISTGSEIRHYSTSQTSIINASGAGDTFIAIFLAAIIEGNTVFSATKLAIAAAYLVVNSEHTIPPHLNKHYIIKTEKEVHIHEKILRH